MATLTGFKWITRAAADLVFGYEEALGYAVAPGLVRDKDGISAGLLAAELTAQLRAHDSSIPQRLERDRGRVRPPHHGPDLGAGGRPEPHRRHHAAAAGAAADPAARAGRSRVTDLSPVADVLTFAYDGGRVVVRPSGTEPKLKAYLEVVSSADAAGAATEFDRLRNEVSALLGV